MCFENTSITHPHITADIVEWFALELEHILQKT